jgi:hypothetical protein
LIASLLGEPMITSSPLVPLIVPEPVIVAGSPKQVAVSCATP